MAYYYRLLIIFDQVTANETLFAGEIEVAGSYFGDARKGRCGCGATGEVPVFGLLKHGSYFYARVILDTKGKTLMGIMQNKIIPDSIVYSDACHSYNVLDVSEFKHYRINHSKPCANKKKPH